MNIDLHSHTFYSFCGRDDPHLTCDAAINGGIDTFGISDHNYGIMRNGLQQELNDYFSFLTDIKQEYQGRLKVLRGIELCTVNNWWLPDDADVSFFDYALVECIDWNDSILAPVNGKSGIFDYARKMGCRIGIAHTDLFGFCAKNGYDAQSFFNDLAQCGIFWELNVNYDSIHNHREHQYVKDFMASRNQQTVIKKSGIELSVGFDGHRVEDYLPQRIKDACTFIEDNGIKLVNI